MLCILWDSYFYNNMYDLIEYNSNMSDYEFILEHPHFSFPFSLLVSLKSRPYFIFNPIRIYFDRAMA